VLLVGAALSWAAATVLTKVVLRELTAVDLLGIELTSSAAVAIALVVLRRQPLELRRTGVFAGLGAIQPALSFALFDFGLARTGAADGAILIASESVFGAVLARLLLKEALATKVGAAVVAGFAGSVLVGLGAAASRMTVVGDLLVLAASGAAALYGVGSRRFSGAGDNLAATTVQLVSAALLVLPLAAARAIGGSSHLASADRLHLAAAVVVGVSGGVLPFLAFNAAIRDISVASAGLVANLVPVAAVALAVAFLGESLRWPEILGGALVVVAAAVAGTGDAEESEPCLTPPVAPGLGPTR
jgi:drug/metabolite transporter (DMT)-like permease